MSSQSIGQIEGYSTRVGTGTVLGKPAWWRSAPGVAGKTILSPAAPGPAATAKWVDFARLHPYVETKFAGSVPVPRATPTSPLPTLTWDVTVIIDCDVLRNEFTVMYGAQHNRWPAFELYLNGAELYRRDPVTQVGSPSDLGGPPVFASTPALPLPPRNKWQINS